MKKLIIPLLVLLILSTLCLTSCNRDKTDGFADNGLAYRVLEDGKSCVITGIGDCKDDQITIPDTADGYTVIGIADGAFQNISSISTMVIDGNVTYIGDSAFEGCKGIYAVTLGKNVTEIGTGAFKNCDMLTSVTLGGGLRSIGEDAFYDCDILSDITLPEGLREIGGSAFYSCDSLAAINIPGSVNIIGSSALANCKSLMAITVRENNIAYKSVGGVLFSRDMTTLVLYPMAKTEVSYVIPSEVTRIANGAFTDCNLLQSITIGARVTDLGTEPFSHCANLQNIIVDGSNPNFKSIDGDIYSLDGTTLLRYAIGKVNDKFALPSGVIGIGDYAFAGCKNLRSISLPDTTLTIGKYAFFEATGLNGVLLGMGLTELGEGAFSGCTSIPSIAIPNGVKAIAKNTFYECDSLKSISLPTELETIGASAFYGCNRLSSIDFPSSLTDIGTYAFYGCNSLSGVKIPDGVTTITNNSFEACTALKNLVIGDSVTSIGEYAFYNCSSLKTISIGKSLESIDPTALINCISLVEITVHEENGNYTFASGGLYSTDGKDLIMYVGDPDVTEITLPDGLLSIRAGAFAGRTTIEKVIIPGSVKTIGDEAFMGCSALRSVVIGDGVTDIGASAFKNCSAITELHLGSSVKSIGKAAFYGATSLVSIKIPDSVTTIGSSAFYGGDSLISVELGSGVSSIENSAFYNCKKLVEVVNNSRLDISVGSNANGYIGYYAIDVHDGESKIDNHDGYLFYNLKRVIYLLGYVGDDRILTLPNDYNGKKYEIYKYAFAGNKDIISITLSDKVITIGESAFEGCSGLVEVINHTTMNIYPGAQGYGQIGRYAIEVHKGESKIVTEGEYIFYIGERNYLVKYTGTDRELVLPDSYNGESYEIHDYSFSGSNIKSITIGEGINTIGASAFADCVSLTKVIINKSVRFIDKSAFKNCYYISKVSYTGTAEDWAAIEIRDDNTYLVDANIQFEYVAE